MLIIDQTAGEVEETSISEAEVGCSETLINNTAVINSNNNKVTHVTSSEVADTESKKSKPLN